MITLYPGKMPKWMNQMYCIVLCFRTYQTMPACPRMCRNLYILHKHIHTCFIMFHHVSMSLPVLKYFCHASWFSRIPSTLHSGVSSISTASPPIWPCAWDSTNQWGDSMWQHKFDGQNFMNRWEADGRGCRTAKRETFLRSHNAIFAISQSPTGEQNIQIFAAFWSNLYQRFAWHSALISNLLHWVTWRKHEDPEVAATKPPPTKNSRLSCPL